MGAVGTDDQSILEQGDRHTTLEHEARTLAVGVANDLRLIGLDPVDSVMFL